MHHPLISHYFLKMKAMKRKGADDGAAVGVGMERR